ncbi:DUF87 domain-containing protein [Candidatus Pacearchaeota archaeon]|nr:DUF87 domain-containing protein [Candidatus Pacearchaeota archaeon]
MYEIPQQLEYKEKIVFGLTFEQLAYAFLLIPIALLILFKTNLNLFVRIFLAIIPSSLAVGLMFFNLKTYLLDIYNWYKNKIINNQQRMQKLFGIKQIKDNIIYVNNKKLAILKVSSLDFLLKSEDDKNALISSFQKFLNSIDFPIQIFISTENLSVNEYLKILSQKDNDKPFEDILKEYKNHLNKVIYDNKIINRNFYIIIPETKELSIQKKIIEERLSNLNLKSIELTSNDIQKLFIKLFETEEDRSLLPKEIINNPDYFIVDDRFHRVIYTHSYPRKVESGFLDKIISFQGDFNISLHIETTNPETTLISVNKELQKQRADLYSAKLKHQLNPSLEIKYKDTLKTLENLQKGKEKLFTVSLYIDCQAESKEELDLLTRKVEAELNSLLIIPKIPKFKMLKGFLSCIPLSNNSLKNNKDITTSALSAFFPFTSSFFKFDPTGIWFGLGRNNVPIIRDIFKLFNANGVCLASSGSGKSYLSKLLISRHLLNGTKVIIIDPQGEYNQLTKKFGGQVINLARDSKTMINPLDLMGHEYPDKRLALMDIMPLMIGDITDPQKSFLDKAITHAYEKKGIYMDEPNTWNYEPPKLEDVYKRLTMLESEKSSLEKVTIRSLKNRLSLYTEGVFSFLNNQTNLNLNNKLVNIDISKMPRQIKPIIMFLIMEYVYTKMKADIDRKLLVVDEAWSLLSQTKESSYIFEIVKTCRKFNLGLFLINQEVEDMINSKAGRSVLANSSHTILLRQKPSVINDIQKIFHLSEYEKDLILTSMIGEGLIIMDDEHSKLKILASEKEHEIITTNADEINDKKNGNRLVKNIEDKSKKRVSIDITIDDSKGVHKLKDLSKKEIKHLKKKGFLEYNAKSILSDKFEDFLLRPRGNESPQHFFLTYEIAKYLKRYTKDVYLYETVKPDIIFKVHGKVYAIEVETGSLLKTNKKALLKKVNTLNKIYKNNWFFVVTNKGITPKYARLGSATDKRYVKIWIDKIVRRSKNYKKQLK